MTKHTLTGVVRHEIEVRKSRFLALAAPAATPEAALAWLAEVADADATHNCWAYRIGQNYRFSDDGEPGGSAGRPILAAIEGQGFDQVLAVVTRWYGGTKLGVGGLVRAYGGVVAECLRTAPRLPLIERIAASVDCGFEHVDLVHQLLGAHAGEKTGERYSSDGLHLELLLPRDQADALALALRDATRGQARLRQARPHQARSHPE